jgi:hypothetical protein
MRQVRCQPSALPEVVAVAIFLAIVAVVVAFLLTGGLG